MIGISDESFTSINSFEYNPSNYSVIKDWGFSFAYGGEFGSTLSSNLYQVSATKSFGKHFLSLDIRRVIRKNLFSNRVQLYR